MADRQERSKRRSGSLRILVRQLVDVGMPDLAGMLDAWMTICTKEIVEAHAKNYPSRANEYGRICGNSWRVVRV